MKNNSLFFVLIAFAFLYSSSVRATESKCTSAMDSITFMNYTKDVSAHDFDDAKIKSIKIELNSKCFSSLQIKTLLALLSFEEDKLSLAKLAFSKVTDPENFKMILSIFEFDSSKKEINDFIAASK